MNILLLPEAEADLGEALDHYLANASIEIATDLQREVKRVAALLAELPRLGRSVGPSTRAFGLKRFPYNVIYAIQADTLIVVALAHHRQDPTYWRERV